MIRTHWAALCMLAAMAAPGTAGAGDAAGMLKVVKGSVSIERDGKRHAAGVGMPVEVADRVRTGPDGSVGVTLRDNTLLTWMHTRLFLGFLLRLPLLLVRYLTA